MFKKAIKEYLQGEKEQVLFQDSYKNEHEKMLQFFKGTKRELTEKDLERFYKSVSYSSFRQLYQEAGLKQRYLP